MPERYGDEEYPYDDEDEGGAALPEQEGPLCGNCCAPVASEGQLCPQCTYWENGSLR